MEALGSEQVAFQASLISHRNDPLAHLVHYIATAASDNPDEDDGPGWPLGRQKRLPNCQEEACRI